MAIATATKIIALRIADKAPANAESPSLIKSGRNARPIAGSLPNLEYVKGAAMIAPPTMAGAKKNIE